MQNLFTTSFFRKHQQNLQAELGIDDEQLKQFQSIVRKRAAYVNAFASASDSEERDWPDFERDVFRDLLGYAIKSDNPQEYNVFRQQRIQKAGRRGGTGKADCALGFYSREARQNEADQVIVEYKAPDSPDLSDAANQLWNYLENHTSAKWGIVTNFNEILLYNVSERRLKTQRFYFVVPEYLKERKVSLEDKDELLRFLAIFRKDRLLSREGKSQTQDLLDRQGIEEKQVEKAFYARYYRLRNTLFETIVEHNEQYRNDREQLVSLTQKILDRLIFIWFCEDSREQLLPPNILANLIKSQTEINPQFREPYDLWEKIKRLFHAVDKGNAFNISLGYNGELFKPDARIETLRIPNEIFETEIRSIGEEYDFGHENELSVNILGHIFEQSVSDLEELRRGESETSQHKKGRRKREGIFYTPEHITRYIAEQALGSWLAAKRQTLGEDRLPEMSDALRQKAETWGSRKRRPKFTPKFTKAVFAELDKAIASESILNKLKMLKKNYKDEAELRANLSAFEELKDWQDVIVSASLRAQVRTDSDWEIWQTHLKFWSDYREALRNIKVLDPACGSGAFLIQAFDLLYEEGQKANQQIAELGGEEFLFDLDKQILENNLYGVDINAESVEITKLSLWLKTANRRKKLNNLSHNIKCGNSLIDDPKIAGKKAFCWEKEFPEITASRGFDVVIGNPPYIQSHSISGSDKTYFYEHYQTAEYQLNTFGLFIEKSLALLKKNAFYCLIVPNYWLSTKFDEKLRQFVFISNHALSILNVFNVFEDASVDTLILFGKKEQQKVFPKKTYVRSLNSDIRTIKERLEAIHRNEWHFEKEILFSDENSETKISFDEKVILKGRYKLSDFVELKQGMKPYEKGKGNPPQTREMMRAKVYDAKSKLDETYLPLLSARNIKRYAVLWKTDWIKYGKNLAAPRSIEIFQHERMLISRIISGEKIEGTFLHETFINNTDLINIIPKADSKLNIKVLAAILLSELCCRVLKKENVNLNRKTFPKINVETLKAFPIPEISASDQKMLADNADKMLLLNQAFFQAKENLSDYLKQALGLKKMSRKLTAPENLTFEDYLKELRNHEIVTAESRIFESLKTYFTDIALLKTEIDRTDAEIDRRVYDLYHENGK